MKRGLTAVAVLVGCVALAACEFPRDPEETLDRVEESGTMHVGVIDSPPWVVLDEGREPQGVEPTLVREFADELGAEVEWVAEPEDELMEALRGFQLDIVIGGLDRTSPYAREVAFTRPYLDTTIQFATPPGEELPEDLDEVEIYVEQSSEAAALLQQEEGEANPIYYRSEDEIDGFALMNDYDIEAIGYDRTDRIQRDHEHAMAIPMGENAWMVELESFLLDRGQEIEELLDAEVERQKEAGG